MDHPDDATLGRNSSEHFSLETRGLFIFRFILSTITLPPFLTAPSLTMLLASPHLNPKPKPPPQNSVHGRFALAHLERQLRSPGEFPLPAFQGFLPNHWGDVAFPANHAGLLRLRLPRD